jgi:hypothetical protein
MLHIDVVRRRGIVRALLPLLTVVLLATGTTAPAQAERYIHHDRSHDVRGVVFDAGTDGWVKAPHRRQGDFVKVKIWHQVKAVRVVGKYRRLDRVGTGFGQVVSIRTEHDVQSFQVLAGPGMWKGFRDEGAQRCIIGHKVNYERNRFSMRISRACLGRPAWVRVGAGFISFNRRGYFADDSQLRKVRRELTWSPRLRHA